MTSLQPPSHLRQILYGIFIGVSLSLASASLAQLYQYRRRNSADPKFKPRPIELRSDEVLNGLTGLIGNTPLVRVNSLSDALGVEILGKAEFLNPGGSVKDRVALRMIDDAERLGLLRPHTRSRIFEGTVGSTGISIATVAAARGYESTIIMPDDVAEEKVKALLALGANVERVKPVSIVDAKQYVNLARQRALNFSKSNLMEASNTIQLEQRSPNPQIIASSIDVVCSAPIRKDLTDEEDVSHDPRGFFGDQFENKSNFDAHFESTGPEIWRQTNGHLDAFVSGAGTGGTIAGVGRFMKSMNENIAVILADPEGSGLFNKVKFGVMFHEKEKEGTKRRHQVDTVVEGIGINRTTKNIELALPIIDDAIRVTDAEAVSMSRYIMRKDGLFLGSSSACNLVACVKLVNKMKWSDGKVIVTILCDSGSRHYSKFWNDDYLQSASIPIDLSLTTDLLQV